MAFGGTGDANGRVHLITVILSIVSVLCSIYLWANIKWMLGRKRERQEKFILLTVHVFGMGFCDMGFSLTFVALYLPLLTHGGDFWQNEHGLCGFLSVVSQFFQIAAFSWYSCICWVLFSVLQGSDFWDVEQSVLKHKICVFVTSVVCVGLSVAATLGEWWPLEHYADENTVACWSQTTRYVFYVYLTIVLCISGVLLIWSWRKLYRISKMVTPAMQRILLYVTVFWLVWFPPLLERYIFMFGGNSPNWLVELHNYCMAFSGTANFLVWRFSNIWKRARRVKKAGHSNDSVQANSKNEISTLLLGDQDV